MYVTAMTEESCMDLKESKGSYMGGLGGRKWKGNDVISLESQKINASFFLIQDFFQI